MTIYCKVCKFRIQSLLIDQVEATREIYAALDKHVLENHKKELKEQVPKAGILQVLCSTYSIIDNFAIIPNKDEQVYKTHKTVAIQIANLLHLKLDSNETEEVNKDNTITVDSAKEVS